MNIKEWYERAERGTSGDMVFDILRDWKKEREQLAAKPEMLCQVCQQPMTQVFKCFRCPPVRLPGS